MPERLVLEDIGTFVALGHTYASHRQYDRPPKWPILWTVPAPSIIPDGEPIRIPDSVEGVVPGAELAVVIGDRMWQATATETLAAIAGFTVSNDVRITGSFPGYPYGDEQDYAIGRGYHILPTFSPTLPVCVPLDPATAGDLAVEILIDDDPVFAGSTSEMDWPIIDLVQHVSSVVELHPGDVVSLGDASDPDTFLEHAGVVECSIEGVGTLRNPIVNEDTPVSSVNPDT